jgi:hypothetical protein
MRMARCDAKRCWSRSHIPLGTNGDNGANSKNGVPKANKRDGNNATNSTSGERVVPSREGEKGSLCENAVVCENPYIREKVTYAQHSGVDATLHGSMTKTQLTTTSSKFQKCCTVALPAHCDSATL